MAPASQPQEQDSAAPSAPWHAMEADAALARLDSRAEGLSAEEAEARLKTHGPNALPQARQRSPLLRLAAQFHNLLIYVLLASAALSGAIGHMLDAAIILAVVLLNAAIGFVQEGRAEDALAAIRRMVDPRASVQRDGQRMTIPAEHVVPGDIVLLEAGDRTPADLRLIRARNLRMDEAALTGESVPADKTASPAEADAALGDRSSMAFAGTYAAAGHGAGVVVATGGGTELGGIGAMAGAVETLTTPLIRQMDQFARQVTFAVMSVSALVLAYALLAQGQPFGDAFMIVVGLFVAAIPEGLPAVMTITLAVGVQRMAQRNAIIRRLPAVETLGAVSVICTDKTGTLTRNEMTVRAAVTAQARFNVEGAGYRPEGAIAAEGADAGDDIVLGQLALAGRLCNDAELRQEGEEWTAAGDPMEAALIAFAIKAGQDGAGADGKWRRLDELPFDAERRYMATLNAAPDGPPVLFVKGAPEQVMAMCADAAGADGAVPLDADGWRDRVEAMAGDGQRVLALARRTMPQDAREAAEADAEGGLTLLGLVGLIDPPRAEAVQAVTECAAAGVRVKMITGDHAATAAAIARQLGLAEAPDVATGADLEGLDDEALQARAREADVFARTSPEHKLRLVSALQADGSVVAMTGDGVNDAPALKRADVGVAMGGKGTEAAKQASEMVLADDNFASIVAAVREGRTVYDNLTKVIAWTLPTNGGEALTIVLAVLAGLTLPVTPVQILWINMVTAVGLGLTLAFEPTEPGAMRRPPRPSGRAILSGRLLWRVVFVSVLMVAGTFSLYAGARGQGVPVETARTMVVNAIVAMEIFYLFSVRYVRGALTLRAAMGTRAVWTGVGLIVLAQLIFTYAPPMHAVFETRPLSLTQMAITAGLGAVLLLAVEVEKLAAAALERRKR